MAIPQAFLDVLNTLQILPLPRSQPGDLVKPATNKDLGTVFNPLSVGEVLGQLDLNVLINDVSLALITGKDTSEIVLKQVEFTQPVTGLQASQLDTTEPATRKLPYITPTPGIPPVPVLGTLVEGLLGKIGTEASQPGSIVGSLAGTIKGDLTKAAALTSFAPPTISWRIEDDRGNALVSGTDFVSDTTNSLATAAPVFALLPVFVPLSNPAATLTAKRSLFCDLAFTNINGPLNPPFKFSIGPATLEVVEAQVPMTAALTQNPLGATPAAPLAGFPGLTMVAVPGSSALRSLTALSAPLQTLRSILTSVSRLTTLAGFALSPADAGVVGIFGASAGLITALLTAISSVIDPGAFVIADQIMSFDDVEASAGGCGIFGWFACNMNDVVSTVIVIGPPTRSVQCFNRYNLWTGTGQFTLALGMEASAFVADLSVAPAAGTAAGTIVAATPATGAPAGLMLSTLAVNVAAQSGNPFHTPTTFDNAISSMQFM
jgi:hypothetical protein